MHTVLIAAFLAGTVTSSTEARRVGGSYWLVKSSITSGAVRATGGQYTNTGVAGLAVDMSLAPAGGRFEVVPGPISTGTGKSFQVITSDSFESPR